MAVTKSYASNQTKATCKGPSHMNPHTTGEEHMLAQDKDGSGAFNSCYCPDLVHIGCWSAIEPSGGLVNIQKEYNFFKL